MEHRRLSFLFKLFILHCLAMAASPLLALTELKQLDSLTTISGPDKRNVGWQWHYVDQDGKPGMMEKVGGDDQVASYKRSDGCSWTRTTSGFAPATEWNNCPSAGTADVTLNSGTIWPLVTGNRFTYVIKGTSSLWAKAWKSRRKCRVAGSYRIEIASGRYDTWKVICKERWGTRTWWLSPKVGTAVAYQQKTVRGGLVLQEMTHIIAP